MAKEIEIKGFNDEQKQSFQAVVDQLSTDLQDEVKEILKDYEGKGAIDSLKSWLGNIGEGQTDILKKMQDQIDSLEADLQKSAKNPQLEVKSIGDCLNDLAKNDEFAKLAKSIKEGKKGTEMTFDIKADVLTTALTGERQRSIIESGVDKPLYRMPFLRQLLPNVPTQAPTIYWTERTARTDGSGGVAEGNSAGQSDSTWEEKSAKVVKRGVYFKYSNESFEDIPSLIEDLRMDTQTEMALDIDDQLLNGDGTGTNFSGLITNSTAFNATTVGKADKVAKANLADLMRCAALQVQLKHFTPDTVLINPSDMVDLELEKTTEGNYIMPPFASADGTVIAGMRVITNTGVAAGTMTVMDSTKPRFYVRRDMQLQVWDQNEDDARKDLKTVTLWFRGQLRVRENEKLAIVHVADITAAIAALDPALP